MNQPPENPQTLFDLVWYIKYYEESIYVRSNCTGKWKSVPLADVPAEEWVEHLNRWYTRRIVPLRAIRN